MNSRPLRITILSLHYAPEPTGNAPYVSSLAEELTARGHEVRVICAHPHYPEWRTQDGYGQWRRREPVNGVDVVRLSHYVPVKPSGIRRLLSEVTFGLRLLFARWGTPDLVILASPALFSTAIASARALASARRPKVVVWVQDLYSLGMAETGQSRGGLARVMTSVESWVLQKASGVVVIHDRFRRYVVERLGVPEGQVEVVRNWSHVSVRQDVDRGSTRERLGWNGSETIALHAGNMGAKQGLENVIDAARIAQETGANVRFVLLGHGNQRAAIESRAVGLRTVEFIDPLPPADFEAALLSADVLLVNERAGVAEMSVPSKLTTYFSTGLPVVAATDEGSITAEEIDVSAAGLRVDAGDPAALLDAVLLLGSDPELSHRLGIAGRRFREGTLSQQAAIDKYDAWLGRVASSQGSEPHHADIRGEM